MVLTVDIGNSNIVLGGYEDGRLSFSTRFATERKQEADQFAVEIRGLLQLYSVDKSCITDVVISSVVPGITSLVAGALRRIVPVHALMLTTGGNTGVEIDIDNRKLELKVPEEVLEERRKHLVLPEPRIKKGFMRTYADNCLPPERGAAMQNWLKEKK